MIPKNLQPLFDSARSARENSYSPYSRFRVGATVRMRDGRSFSGSNVENASYGGAICAERVAILKAVNETATSANTSGARPFIEELLVVTDTSPPASPCGFCRQVIAEFADPKTLIHTCNLKGDIRTFTFEELVPEAFTPDQLPPAK